jgi:hypothetical protein
MPTNPVQSLLLAAAGEKSYSPWPVWTGSTAMAVKFVPLPKRKAVDLWHRARAFDRKTRREGGHGGVVGHTALQVLHALIFDFLNFRSGRLDPSYAAIAKAANVCERTVATAINRLRSLGILAWVRRCAERRREDGQYVLEQQTNAYGIRPPTQWLGYREPPSPPPPPPGTWGAHPPLPDMVTLAAMERARGASPVEVIGILEGDSTNRLAQALARLGRAIGMGKNDGNARTASPAEKPPR